MTYAILDVETTIFQKGHPYSDRNRLCYIGLRTADTNSLYSIEYDGQPYDEQLRSVDLFLSNIDVLVGFNLKFDLAWLNRYGIKFDHCEVFDLQLCEFILSSQQSAMPSLDGCLSKYNLGAKSRVVEEEYWNRGIDTPEIPREILEEYLASDLTLTEKLYRHMLTIIPNSQKPLIRLQNQDLLCLLEMERNGILFDWKGIGEARDATRNALEAVESTLRNDWLEGWLDFNFDSVDHVSCLLYGGTVNVDISQPEERVYKSGPKKGFTYLANKWYTVSKTFPRLVDPLKGSALKKDGYWSTDEPTLRRLPKPKKLISLLLQRAELEKLLGTYYKGIPDLLETMDWKDGIIHGQFNQCVARTGRLSASRPNQQNFDGRINQFIISRY